MPYLFSFLPSSRDPDWLPSTSPVSSVPRSLRHQPRRQYAPMQCTIPSQKYNVDRRSECAFVMISRTVEPTGDNNERKNRGSEGTAWWAGERGDNIDLVWEEELGRLHTYSSESTEVVSQQILLGLQGSWVREGQYRGTVASHMQNPSVSRRRPAAPLSTGSNGEDVGLSDWGSRNPGARADASRGQTRGSSTGVG